MLFEDGGLLREEQVRLVREALVLVQRELASGRDMVNRALRIWADSTHVFESLPWNHPTAIAAALDAAEALGHCEQGGVGLVVPDARP